MTRVKEDIEGVLYAPFLIPRINRASSYYKAGDGDIGGVARCQKYPGREPRHVSMRQLAAHVPNCRSVRRCAVM